MAACGCDATGSGRTEVLCSSYFEIGDTSPASSPLSHVIATPQRGSYFSDARVSVDKDKGGSPRVRASLHFDGFGLTYAQTVDGYKCRELAGGWTRCSGEEREDLHHGPMHWEIDLRGDTLVRAWVWEMKPSASSVYLGKAKADRGPRLAAFFGNGDYPHEWPKGSCDDPSPSELQSLAGSLKALQQKDSGPASPASVVGGGQKELSQPGNPGGAGSGASAALPAH